MYIMVNESNNIVKIHQRLIKNKLKEMISNKIIK
jgi:hypothetical protein